MSCIFISYRRTDSAITTERLYDCLTAYFGADRILMNIDTNPMGVGFHKVVADKVGSCAVLIAVIGARWLSITNNLGQRRLDNPSDLVRLEIMAALTRGIPVIPALVQDARMPAQNALPEALKGPAWRDAIELDYTRFDSDVARLIRTLELILSPDTEQSTPPRTASPARATGQNILPSPFEWVNIPAGVVTLEDDKGSDIDTFDVQAFTVAKYPITNAQYQVFVEATDGYQEAQWWAYSADAVRWRAKHTVPKKTAFPGRDLPRTRVNWYEAVAFCRWLGDKVGQHITLPTEQQWQHAAQGNARWVYPWGNRFEAGRCNTSGSNIERPTPVMHYFRGANHAAACGTTKRRK